MVNVNRKEFMLIAAVILSKPISGESAPSKITIDHAVSNSDLRQKFIDQLVEKESSPYVLSVDYDHDYLKLLEMALDYGNTPEFWQGLRQAGINNKQDLLDFVKSEPMLIADIKQMLVGSKLENAGAMNSHFHLGSYDFGQGKKTKVLVFKLPFEPYKIAELHEIDYTIGSEEIKPILIHPTEESVREVLHHEYTHAEDFYKGIVMTNGLRIGPDNYNSINPKVMNFVVEIRAYIGGIHYTEQFGRDHPAFIEACHMCKGQLKKYQTVLNQITLNTFERQLVQQQVKEIQKVMPLIEIGQRNTLMLHPY